MRPSRCRPIISHRLATGAAKPRTLRRRLTKLYYFPSSPHCLKVRAVAYGLDVHLELTAVNVFRRERSAR
jgi:hypothetical protein